MEPTMAHKQNETYQDSNIKNMFPQTAPRKGYRNPWELCH